MEARRPVGSGHRPLRQDGAVFTEEDLLNAAGPAVFERGVEYLRYVRGL